MRVTDEIEEQLGIGVELLKTGMSDCENMPVITIFINDNYETKVLYPAQNEKNQDFIDRLKGLSKDYNPDIIVGCDPIDKKEYDGLIIAVHIETKENRCFYHKKGNKLNEGWEETFDI